MNLSGGLGNQLFQICAGFYIEKKLGIRMTYDVTYLSGEKKNQSNNYTRTFEVLDLLDSNQIVKSSLPLNLYSSSQQLKMKLSSDKYIFEANLLDDLISRITPKTQEISGYFQNAKIVETVWPQLKARLASSNRFSKILEVQPTNQIAVHLRFGDYIDNPNTKKIFGLTEPSYYEKSIQLFKSLNFEVTEILVVSDSYQNANDFLNWEKFECNVSFISSDDPVTDFCRITESSNVIMSNSTFSWWGAWFAHALFGAKVIMPSPWFAESDKADPELLVQGWRIEPRLFSI